MTARTAIVGESTCRIDPYDDAVDVVFFTYVRDAIEGVVVTGRRDVRAFAHGRGVKVWFGDSTREHYEAQLIRVGEKVLLEIGFHSEHSDASKNDDTIRRLVATEGEWRTVLDSAEVGPFLGRRGWTRISECWDPPKPTLDSAIDVAARLADYIVQLEPRRRAA